MTVRDDETFVVFLWSQEITLQTLAIAYLTSNLWQALRLS